MFYFQANIFLKFNQRKHAFSDPKYIVVDLSEYDRFVLQDLLSRF